jgi:hypothetical protein
LVSAGTYTGQDIEKPSAKAGTEFITIKPVPGAAVIVSGLGLDGTSYIELQGFTTSGWAVANSQHIVLRNIKSGNVGLPGAPGGYIANTQDLKVYDSEIGPQNPRDGLQIWPSANGHNKDIVFDGLYMHDLSKSLDTAEHTDCVQLADGENVTFTRSRFYNCATQGFYPGGDFGGGVVKNVTLENSWIGDAQEGFYGLQIAGPLTGITVRNNTITGGVNLDTSATDAHIIGNFFAEGWSSFDYTCSIVASRAVEFKYNLINATGCNGADATNKISNGARTTLVNPDADTANAYDLHIKAGSPAIDIPGFTTTTGCASTDFDGTSRPAGSLCDAGADEVAGGTGGTPKTGDLNSDNAVNIFDLSILLSNYGKTKAQASNPACDLNNDSTINIFDLSILLSNYGK